MRISGVLAVAMVLLSSGTCFADSEADQLRDALRSAILQSREAEDQRAEVQATLVKLQQDAAREKATAAAQLRAAKAETKKLDKEYRDAVDQFNQRLQERDDALEKWKSAYEEAATVARAKDAERAKFQGEATTFKASTKTCVDKNHQLVKDSSDLLHQYQSVTIGDVIGGHEPVLGIKRTEFETKIQDFGDKFLDQKANP